MTRGRRQRRRNRSHRKIQQERGIIDGADIINSMPDEILHHILSFIPIDLAMRTCVLSRRWRHVWYQTPSLDIDELCLKAGGIKQVLVSYTAPQFTSFKLRMSLNKTAPPHIDSLIEFAISRKAENLSVVIRDFTVRKSYSFPECFYLSSSVKQLSVRLSLFELIPRCTVSWKSLRNLSLSICNLRDESIDNILAGCPVLESLAIFGCCLLERLDLSKSLSLKRLEIGRSHPGPAIIDLDPTGPTEIVAPHIDYLRLRIYPDKKCTLVDVSSLTEATLTIDTSVYCRPTFSSQTMAVEFLAKPHNVERLTLGGTLLQILSLAALRGVLFPTLKVQTLTIRTEFAKSVIPSLSRLLQNSPGLKKLTVHTMHSHSIMDMDLDQCWRSKYEVFPTSKEIYSMLGCNDATSKLLASFIKLVLRLAKTLKTMVVWLRGSYFDDAQWFEELLQMVGTLSHNNNVSIVLKRSNC